jgi:transporter family protein
MIRELKEFLNMSWMIYASLAAVFFGIRGIFYLKTAAMGLDRNELLFGIFTSGMILSLVGSLFTGQHWTAETLIGLLMGICSTVANASILHGFRVGKPSLVAILTSLPPAVVIIVAYLIWRETLTFPQLIAFVIIILGILFIRYSNELKAGQWQGAQWGALAMVAFGFNDIFSKMSTRMGADVFPTLFFMFAIGTVYFGLLVWRHYRGQSPTRSLVSSITIGLGIGITNWLGMIFIVAAFAIGITSLVSAITSMSVLIILFYSRFFQHERFKPVEIIGIATALVGVILLQLF